MIFIDLSKNQFVHAQFSGLQFFYPSNRLLFVFSGNCSDSLSIIECKLCHHVLYKSGFITCFDVFRYLVSIWSSRSIDFLEVVFPVFLY